MELVASVPSNAGAKMGGAGGGGGGGAGIGSEDSPFQHRDVQEWSHLDSITGMMEHAHVQTDRWAANTRNSTHKYGKVVDSRDRSAADGNVQQRQRKQLEVFQTQTPGGSLQVIRTQTISSSSSRWSSTSSAATPAKKLGGSAFVPTSAIHQDFENLQLALNPLDLSSQKSKASVGRSGSIGGRRPPSRPRSLISSKNDAAVASPSPALDADVTLARVSQICQQIHEDSLGGDHQYSSARDDYTVADRRLIANGCDDHIAAAQIPERDHAHEPEDDDDQLDHWRRSAKIRRSLQFPRQVKPSAAHRPLDLPDNIGSVSKIKQDLETGRRLNTAFRGTNVDLDALDQLLKSISPATDDQKFERPERDEPNTDEYSSTKIKPVLTKRQSFITAESLQEVRSRLRRLNSPDRYSTDDVSTPLRSDETDDGIDAEDITLKIEESSEASPTRVRSYVFGMETMMNGVRKTGSLESRTSNKSSGTSSNRSEDWYNRRKSYGFEQVHNQNHNNNLQSKNESSTDSGICRSTEIVLLPSTLKSAQNKYHNDSNRFSFQNKENLRNKTTVVNLINKHTTSVENSKMIEHVDPFTSKKARDELTNAWNKIASFKNTHNDTYSENTSNTERESVTIRIPIKSDSTSKDTWTKKSEEHASRVHLNTDWKPLSAETPKRHSIAVDESKYVTRGNPDHAHIFPQHRRTSLAVPDSHLDRISLSLSHDGTLDDDLSQQGKRHKRVEFCKTEVHFAAESGRVNIVETDGKPPPTQNFRRRRRNSREQLLAEETARNGGLPLIRFGDTSYEKKLFTVAADDGSKYNLAAPPEPEIVEDDPDYAPNATVTAYTTPELDLEEDAARDSSENDNTPRGILKNKLIKPKPYHLGDNINGTAATNITPWGVRLRPVQPVEDSPMWRSTVTLKNTAYDTKPAEQFDTFEDKSSSQSQSQFAHTYEQQHNVSISEVNSGLRVNSSPVDVRRASWSVADRIKQVEELQWSEAKGYSTKVNFGEIGDVTVVDNRSPSVERNTTWPRRDEKSAPDEKKTSSLLSKALVVRFGSDANTDCVNEDNSTTTTTKITIDMSPTTAAVTPAPIFNRIKLPRASLHSLKSTSLIMSTMQKPAEKEAVVVAAEVVPPFVIPQQLEALKRLYEEAGELSDDSEQADEEVRSYMSAGGEDSESCNPKDETSSVLSGSWSKMRAIQNMKKHSIESHSNGIFDINKSKGTSSQVQFTRENVDHRWTQAVPSKDLNKPIVKVKENVCTKQKISTHFNKTTTAMEAQKVEMSSVLANRRVPLKNSYNKQPEAGLSSPSLVGLSIRPENPPNKKSPYFMTNGKSFEENLRHYPAEKPSVEVERKETPKTPDRRSVSPTKEVSYLNRRNCEKSNIYDNHRRSSSPTSGTTRDYLRSRHQPAQTYFGAIRSPRTPRKYSERINALEKRDDIVRTNHSLLSNKPDLLCHGYKDQEPIKECDELTESAQKINGGISPCPSAYDTNLPLYANIEETSIKPHPYPLRSLETIENETAILEELTRAADQILQAVNGYTDEESFKISTDEDEDVKRRKGQYPRKTAEVLGTISETKSWHQRVETVKATAAKVTPKPAKLTGSSTSSSIESSLTRGKVVKAKVEADEKAKRKTSSDSSVKATRARRLQRASSREALLQSHGSSSEDITTPAEVLRKPRLTRRTKSHSEQAVSSSSSQTKRLVSNSQTSRSTYKREIDISKNKERLPTTGPQEIRHKTAISTIRSSAEKQADREKSKRTEELRKKGSSSKKETISSQGTSHSSGRLRGASSRTCDTSGFSTRPERVTTSGHVLSSRRCSRNEALSRH